MIYEHLVLSGTITVTPPLAIEIAMEYIQNPAHNYYYSRKISGEYFSLSNQRWKGKGQAKVNGVRIIYKQRLMRFLLYNILDTRGYACRSYTMKVASIILATAV